MKKFMVGLIIGLLFITTSAFAIDRSNITTFSTYTIVNISTSDSLTTAIPTTSIYPKKDRLFGYSIIANYSNSLASERWIEVYDNDDVAIPISAEVLAENEATGVESAGDFYAYPRNIEIGITVRQGANTIATIYFDR